MFHLLQCVGTILKNINIGLAPDGSVLLQSDQNTVKVTSFLSTVSSVLKTDQIHIFSDANEISLY